MKISLVVVSLLFLSWSAVAQQTAAPDPMKLIDSRDKNEYRTVRIGTQVWTAENLRFRPANSQKFSCYADDEKNCEKYGVLYAWEAAIEACPQGWRMPSSQDWDRLKDFLEVKAKQPADLGKMLIDAGGFNALFAGFRTERGSLLLGEHSFFWSNEIDTAYTEQATRFGRYFGRHLYKQGPDVVKFEPSRGKPDQARSLRCIQN